LANIFTNIHTLEEDKPAETILKYTFGKTKK